MASAEDRIERDTRYGKKHSNSSNKNEEEHDTSGLSTDEQGMRHMGKVQQTRVRLYNNESTKNVTYLKQRSFSLLSLLGFTTIILNS